MTNEGEVVQIGKTALLTIRMYGWFKCYLFGFEKLRLLEQTTFTHLPEGTPPPVVEGLVFEYEYCGEFGRDVDKTLYRGENQSKCIAYRVIGCAPGYTDNPELAK
jgi:hypothetical protein